MTTQNYPGYFITFEGPDGSGKTSVISGVEKWAMQRGLDIMRTREPGGTKVGDAVRNILHEMDFEGIAVPAEVLGYQMSRAQLYAEIIIPKLQAGTIILCDRSIDSSIAYQGHARGLGCYFIESLNDYSTGGIRPDLTFLLDLTPEEGLRRKQAGKKEWNRMDALSLNFHIEVRRAYLALAQMEDINGSDRWEIINADRELPAVLADTLCRVERRLTEAGFLERRVVRERE